MTENGKLKVLYIMGMGRSGSTLLGNVLGQCDGIEHIGELQSLWYLRDQTKRRCGCGRVLPECDAWGPALDALWQEYPNLTFDKIGRIADEALRGRHAICLSAAPALNRLWRRREEKSREYARIVAFLYRRLADQAGARVIVDSSKNPAWAYAMRYAADLDLYVIHLIRDSRAVTYSWLSGRHRTKPTTLWGRLGEFHRWGVYNNVVWLGWNMGSLILRGGFPQRVLLVPYSDFAAQPRTVLGRILEFIGESDDMAFFSNESSLRLDPTHACAGNPNRYRTGETTIRGDVQWRESLSPAARAVSTLLTWPGLALWR